MKLPKINLPKPDPKKALHIAGNIARTPLPSSLNWVFGFGFKVGVFLFIKSFLAIRFLHLSFTGFLMVLVQFGTGVVLTVYGLHMQKPGALDNPNILRKTANGYGAATIIGTVICILKACFHWNFFRDAVSKNVLLDFLNGVLKGVNEITLSFVFWDIDLWTAFCGLLFLMTLTGAKLFSEDHDSLPIKSE